MGPNNVTESTTSLRLSQTFDAAIKLAKKMLEEDADDNPDRNDRIHEDALQLCEYVVRLEKYITLRNTPRE